MTIQSIMVIDDDPIIRELLVETLADGEFDTRAFESPVEAIERFAADPADVVFTDLMMPEMSGLDVIREIKRLCPATTVFMMTAHHGVDKALEALRLGADDYLCKPFLPAQIDVLLAKTAERRKLVSENTYLRREVCSDNDFVIGNDQQMIDLFDRVRKVARSKASVMIHGETGSGKEVVAKVLHRSSDRASKPFIKVNCAALSENLLESELFGHEKGAFTGADARHEGRFELADGGTILLDEISEISPRLQAKLLRVLEEEEFERVGGSRTLCVDVRVISTTNRDLSVEIQEHRFREDLFYRLNVVPLHIAPLRERPSDIPLLAQRFLDIFSKANGRPAPRLTPVVVRRLQAYHWPGNVRELKNLMHRAVVLDGPEVAVPGDTPRPKIDKTGEPVFTGRRIEDVEREMIIDTLAKTDGNKTAAALILGVTPRTLRNKLNRYRSDGYSVPSYRPGRPVAAVGA